MRPAAMLGAAWVLLFGMPAVAAQQARPAVFAVGPTIVQSNPPGFGAEYVPEERINNWTANPGMEPLHIYQYWEASAAGSDATGDYVVCGTRKWDTLTSGFLDGGQYRLYREMTNLGTGRIEIQKLREGVIAPGGYVAAGYEEIGLNNVQALPPATDAVDNYRMANGETWYYAVRAMDTRGTWSDYSAPVAGVAAVAASNNGPRIVTAGIPTPTTNRNYTSASPLVTFSAAGGTAPLSWSLGAGALPTGLVLLTSGAITGLCASAAEMPCSVRVNDSAARNHTRPYLVFRVRPAGDAAAPAAPTNVICEANNGFVYLRWDAPADTDIDHYTVYRARWPARQHQERIYLGSGGPAPLARDLLFVEKECTNAPPPQTRSMRIIALQNETAWSTSGNSVTQEIVAHPAPVPAQMQSENAGAGCLKLTAPMAGEFGIWQYKYSWTGDLWWGATQLPTGRTYRMECWVRGAGLASNIVRLRMPSYADRTVTGIVNGSWVKLSADFVVTNWLQNSISVVGPNFLLRGPGTVYVDNAVVYDVNEPRGACHFTQPIFDIWQRYLGPRERLNKGALRTRYMGESAAHVLNPAVMSCRAWDIVYGAQSEDPLHLHDALQASYESGDSAATRTIPWITANLNWREEDYLHLVEYLAGPAGTPYGDMRIAQRGGITTPWTAEFRALYIEMGNEPWNSGYFFAFRGGFSPDSARTYGRWCQYIWDYVEGHSPYWTNAIKVLIGGWAGALSPNEFTAQARLACPRAERIGMTTYLGGWEAGQGGQIGGTIWTDEGVQQWTTYRDHSGAKYIDGICGLQQTLAQTGLPFEVVMYEGGPSYLMNGLNGVSLTAQEQEVSRNYGRTLAAGIGTLDFWLYGAYRGIKEQEFFTFGEDKGLWASHTFVYTGYRPHPAWQVLQMVNNYCGGGALLVTSCESVPSFDLYTTNYASQVSATAMTLASLYAFQRGSTYAILAMNKKLDGLHNGLDFGDGTTPLTLRLPFSNPSRIVLYKLSGDPRLTNRQQMNFQIVTQEISVAQFAKDFVVSETTGGVSNGLPLGAVFVYVFEDCTPDVVPAAPQVTLNQAATQDDPNDGSARNEVRFTVVFDRPVQGFTNAASALILSGTAEPQTAVITPVASSLGTDYDIAVSGMRRAGTVMARVPAGAAWAVAGGQASSASTSRDNIVTNVFPGGISLAEWEFASTSVPAFQNPTSTLQHVYLAPVALRPGPGVYIDNNQWYNDDAYGVTHVHTPALSLDDYIGWTIAPTSGWSCSVASLQLGGFCFDTIVVSYELRWSSNAFATFESLALQPTNRITGRGLASNAGTVMQVDCAGNAGLQDVAHALEFRLYIWGADGQYTASGIGKLGGATPDLVIKGAIAPRAPYIVTQPESQACAMGTAAVFAVEVDGRAPFAYHWQKDGEPLADATAPVYRIAVVAFAHTGVYHVAISNAYGNILSRAALLSVIPEPLAWSGPTVLGSTFALIGRRKERR